MEAAVVSGIFKIVSNKLAPLLVKEYSLIVGVQKHLLDLNDQVQGINCWLEEVGDKVSQNTPAFNWLRKLKDIAYDVDDIVDEFRLKAEEHDAHGVAGVLSRYMCKKPKSLILQCKAASKLKAIKKRFDAIVKQRTEFHAIANSLLAGHPARDMSQTTANQTTFPTVDVTSVLGRDQEKHQIISKLVDDKHISKTISIIGLGGSGKTTLAKLVFNDCNIVEKHFEVRLWVHVSQEFDVDKLIKKLFEAFADNNPGHHALPYMIKTISDRLTGKMLLLVLDDVWNESLIQWENFMVHLKSSAPGSRILLTARSRRVAETVRSIDQFDLRFLSLDDSWQLFQQSLVIPAGGLDSEFVKVGKEIVKNCGGVPLAIKALAGVLHGMENIQEWKSVRDSNVLDVEGKECIVSACLRLSYFHLPSNLKQCFTICSLFPKGHKIYKEQLIDLWIAHDMITLEDGVDCLDLEYVGHKHFNSLLQVSFLQNVEEEHGRVTCGMHDLVHDLALSILGDEISLDMPNEATSTTKRYRYFSLTKGTERMAPKNIFRKARAVYMHRFGDYTHVMALKHAKHLRSVMVGYLHAQELNTISQVKYLKYLAMSLHSCKRLPKGISDVWSLQALHVTQSNSLIEIPESIGKLKMLRTLNLSYCTGLKSLPDSIGDCQMISIIDLSNCMDLIALPYSIGRNGKLRVLRLGNTKVERLPSSITKLRNLECLDLQGCYELVELPKGFGNLEKLHVLDLTDCKKLGGMPVGIGQLNRLQIKSSFFVVGESKRFAGISELANICWNNEDLTIRGIAHVLDSNDVHRARLRQKTNLQKLGLQWMAHGTGEVNIELEQAVLDGLEPPCGIKKLEICGYSGRQYAQWMQNQVGGGVKELTYFPYLRVMDLCHFPNLKQLNGLVELPCLEELRLRIMPSLESINGGPFPSLVKLEMYGLPCLGEVWMVAERTMADGEEGVLCNNCTLHYGLLRVGNCISDLHISDCPQLKLKSYLPSSLQHWRCSRNNDHLLESPGRCEGSFWSSSFSRLKKLRLWWVTILGCGYDGWEVLQHMTALESLEIKFSSALTKLPESLGSLTSLRSLDVYSCSGISMLPDSLGELGSLQELTIELCNSLSSLPQSMGYLTSLQVLYIGWCPKLHELPEYMCGLTSLQELSIRKCPSLTSLPQGMENLASLQSLSISCCPGIKSLPDGMKGLTALKKLEIYGCCNLSSFPQSIGHLTSLQVLNIQWCDALQQLPECLGELCSLRTLTFSYLPGLTCLPQSIYGLMSLTNLFIHECPGIKSLPQGIKDLTALKQLDIWHCPDLERRCERGKGEDWHLISHILDDNDSIW